MARQSKQLRAPYRGALNTPIKIPTSSPVKPKILGGVGTKEEQETQYQKDLQTHEGDKAAFITGEMVKKMELLKDRFDLHDHDGDIWYQVALNLAIDHVPGFAVKEKGVGGRKEKWNFILYAKLYFDVLKAVKGDFQETMIQTACYDLIEQEPWCSIIIGKRQMPPTAKTLQTRFSEAKKSPLVVAFAHLPDDPKAKQAFYEHVEEMFEEFHTNFPTK